VRLEAFRRCKNFRDRVAQREAGSTQDWGCMRPLASSGRRTIRRTRALDDTQPRGCSSPSVSANTAFTAALVMLCAGVDAAGASGASGSSDIQASLGAAVEDCKELYDDAGHRLAVVLAQDATDADVQSCVWLLPISPRVTAFFDIARLHAKADRGAHLLAVQHLGGRTRLRVRASRPRSRPHGSSGMVALPSESSSFSSGRRQQMSPRARTPSWQPLRTGTRRLGYLPVHLVDARPTINVDNVLR